jgi:alpha-L-glutamate ligase-like protein
MAVSKSALGMNARNYLYIRTHNKRRAKERADDKLLTKHALIKARIPTTRLIASFTTLNEVRSYDWTSLSGDFVLKPARGYGGSGIMVVRKWNGATGELGDGREVTLHDLEAEIFSILDGASSLDNLPDRAFLEERVVVSNAMRKLGAGGVPDVRIIVAHGVPIMAMLRLPTIYSGGKANLHQGAIGIGVDLRTGITTKGIFHNDAVGIIPGTKTKVRGIKIPQWDQVLEVATKTQKVSKLGYAGVDIVHDETKGPLVLEVNARPGLQIQLANGASLRTRLERIEGMKIASVEQGIELGKRLFAEQALAEVQVKNNVLHVIEKVTIFGAKGKKTVLAKVDTGAYRTALDGSLVEELGLNKHHERIEIRSGTGKQTRHTVHITFRLRGKDMHTIASYNDRKHMRFPIIIGRRDLKGFLVDPTVYPEDVR